MTISNPQKDALASNIDMHELGKAMNQLNLSDIPEHKRKSAIFDHFMRVMADTVQDGNAADKIRQARIGRLLKAQQ